ncbi:hypothetical protein D3261_13680 [Halococcus sp. IIIV-5B]|nr:hypothetical protein D3261_13680 [Halococcus sp. IIIV-5B]
MRPPMYRCDSCGEGVSLTVVAERPDNRSTLEYSCSCRMKRIRAADLERLDDLPEGELPHNWERVNVFQPSATA